MKEFYVTIPQGFQLNKLIEYLQAHDARMTSVGTTPDGAKYEVIGHGITADVVVTKTYLQVSIVKKPFFIGYDHIQSAFTELVQGGLA